MTAAASPSQRRFAMTPTHKERRDGVTARVRQSLSPVSGSMQMHHGNTANVERMISDFGSMKLSSESPHRMPLSYTPPPTAASKQPPSPPRHRSARTSKNKKQARGSPIRTPKIFRCEVCDRSYKTARALANHERQSPAHNSKHHHDLPQQLHAATAQRRKLLPKVTEAKEAQQVQRQSESWRNYQFQIDQARLSAVAMGEVQQQIRIPYPWSTISRTHQNELLERLKKKCHVTSELLRYGYRISEPSQADYENAATCRRCGGLRKKVEGKKCFYHLKGPVRTRTGHPQYPCCKDQKPEGNNNVKRIPRGCLESFFHDYNPTTVSSALELSAFKTSPPPSFNTAIATYTTKHQAVALDCEMVGLITYDNNNGHGHGRNRLPYKETNELVHISAVDMLTGEILMNSLVMPPRIGMGQGRIHWRKRVTGLDAKTLEEARIRGEEERQKGSTSANTTILPSWEAAREMLWRYIDASTILVGHALHNDLDVLRMVHTRVVDTEILVAEAVRDAVANIVAATAAIDSDAADAAASIPLKQQYSLRKMCEALLGVKIQQDGQPHDSLEDTFATREVAMALLKVDSSSSSLFACPGSSPGSEANVWSGEVREWAREQAQMLEQEERERRREREKREKEKEEEAMMKEN